MIFFRTFKREHLDREIKELDEEAEKAEKKRKRLDSEMNKLDEEAVKVDKVITSLVFNGDWLEKEFPEEVEEEEEEAAAQDVAGEESVHNA